MDNSIHGSSDKVKYVRSGYTNKFKCISIFPFVVYFNCLGVYKYLFQFKNQYPTILSSKHVHIRPWSSMPKIIILEFLFRFFFYNWLLVILNLKYQYFRVAFQNFLGILDFFVLILILELLIRVSQSNLKCFKNAVIFQLLH